MKINDGLIGAATIAGGGLLISAAGQLREMPGQLYGSRFFPTLVGVALVIVGLCLLAIAFRQWRDQQAFVWLQWPDWIADHRGVRVLAMMIAPVLFIQFAERTGFLLIALPLLVILMLVLGARLLLAIGSATVAALVLHLVFAQMLRVPLPRGVIENWLY